MVAGTPLSLKERARKLFESSCANCSVLSREPVVLYFHFYTAPISVLLGRFQVVFEKLRAETVYCLCSLGSTGFWLVDLAVELQAHCAEFFPNVRFIFLCNESKDVADFEARGLRAAFSNHNAFVDESIFRPHDGVAKSHDAVYDAQFLDLKRHYLCRQIPSLALIYGQASSPEYGAQVRQELAHAHYFNHDQGNHRILDNQAVAGCLNQCRVGLCLSANEGAMYASIQYLLCGLPVVSTPNCGGRDVFFQEPYCLTVEPEPAVVRAGVADLVAQRFDPWLIHRQTVALIRAHRLNLIKLVQGILSDHGQSRDFASEWPELFCDKLLKHYTREQLLAIFDK